jgi:hypothetical protein
MKIADYGKAITSYIESPTRLQKQQSKKAAENFLLITGDRIQLAEGSAPKAKPFTLDQFKEKANIYMAAYQSNSLPVNDIRLALDDFTKKGIADGTFTADEAIKVVKDLRSYYRDLAQKQRLRGVVEGIGTVDRSELVDGGLVKQGPNTGKYVLRYTQDGERLRKFFDTKEEFDKFVKIRQNLPKGGAIGDYTKKISKPSVKEIEIAELVYGNKYNKKGVELWQSLKRKERQGIRQGSTTGSTILKGKGPQPKAPNQLGKEEFIKLAKANKGKTFNEFLEVLKDYKTVRGADFTIEGIRDRLKMYDLGAGFFKREEPKGMSKEVDEKRFQKRKKMLETTAPFKAKGTGGFQFHHIMNIGGEIPLDTNDIAVISAKMNRTLSPYNRDLNNIANDITDLINEQPKGYLKKIDELNDKAEGIVKKAVKELPKEYRNLIGFNRVVPVFDEYGTPVNFVGKKFGGSDQKQPGIKLENLTKEQATDLRKRIKTDALSFEKVGLKDKILSTGGKILKTTGKVIKPVGYAFGANAVKSAITKADDMGIKLSLTDKIMAFDSGDADIAINNYMRRNDPEFAAAERAKDLAKMTDDFEEVGQTTFGKYNDQIKNIKLP